ncbi:occludin-like [Protopterus annectens]|uniref:occludin-like n=1 Tax=Protopterus annectens TaxID=7888 RepID=UPI001CF990AB|nr:occludin-like [Protopterus annectens]XP_043927462.1 occludin-like [Protopterus annectens]XP_043927463.1 occludin-like [Protopterus annectens]
MSSRPIDSPPPYHPGSDYKPSSYAPSRQMYNGDGRNVYKGSRDGLHNGDMLSHRTYSYFPPDEVHCETQHFYKWSSPPGVIKILLILSIVMCVGIFACVASTLPWDLNDYNGLAMGIGGYGSMYGSGVSGFGGNIAGGYGSSSYGYGYGGLGGNYTDPRAAKGFILAMVALCFIFCLVLFVITVSRSQSRSFQTRKFYLIVIIVCAILAFLLLVATIVYIVAVNPTAQAAGTTFYNQLLAICGQFNSPAAAGMLTNLYLYHYCVVDPQEVRVIFHCCH